MMTGKDDDAARAREDLLLGELIPQVTETLAAEYARDFDAEGGRARFQTWLDAHTKRPASRIDSQKAPRRPQHWQLSRTWLARGGILAGASAIVALAVWTGFSPAVLAFFLGALLGVLSGGMLCVRYLRSEIADDIGPQLRRLHADIDPQLRRMQNQLDVIESAVNLAVTSRYAELSQLAWPATRPTTEPGIERDRQD
jgi:hypothetical protein